MQVLVKESKTEKDVKKWAEEVGILVVKMNLRGRKGWPDRIFILPNGLVLWVEFKRPGEQPRDLQAYVHRELRKRKQLVYVADHVADTISYIKAHMESPRLPEEGNPNDADASVRCALL